VTEAKLFLNEQRLLAGPWQALERDIARLLLQFGFSDVRIVAGIGDKGADVLGVQNGLLWIVQCKHTSNSPPCRDAVAEVVNAAKFYGADRLVIATSRPPGDGFLNEVLRYERLGLKFELLTPDRLLRMVELAPEYPSGRRQLRPYQVDVANRLRESLIDTGRGQIVLATGLGKTVVIAETVADLLRDGLIRDGRVLILAHTKNLVSQLHSAFWFQLPKWVATHQLVEGEFPTFWDGITFATVQSARAKIDSLPEFGLVVVDEAHHIGSQTFRETISAIEAPMLAGVTATPWRGDGYDIDEILGPPLARIGIVEGLQEGFLSEVDYRLMADDLDWEFVQKSSRNAYSIHQLNRKLIIPTRDEEAIRVIRRTWDDDKRNAGLVFSPTIVHAESFAAMLRRYGFRAEPISAQSPDRERHVLLSKFAAGQVDFLTTVDLFNEGLDVPDVDLLVFCRATHSRRIFVQQLGRGLRVTQRKRSVVVLDFVTDLRRVAEVLDMDRQVRGSDLERLGMGRHIIQFRDESAGGFLKEWLLDQASLLLREGDPKLELPQLNFPRTPETGTVA